VLVDGDTLRYEGETIRLVDIDTPENFHSRCERELILALAAKDRLRQLVDAGPLTVERHGKDRYGRTLARVLVDGRDVGDTLLREGKALPLPTWPRRQARKAAPMVRTGRSVGRQVESWRLAATRFAIAMAAMRQLLPFIDCPTNYRSSTHCGSSARAT
jgi:hypothetical protein